MASTEEKFDGTAVKQSQPANSAFAFPYATSPDIIRSNQKDLFFTNSLHGQLIDIIRGALGSRFAHTYNGEVETFASLLYFALTTLIGNRTLGEEYTDIYQVEGESARSQKLPAIGRRAGYIASSILLPYAATKILPILRARIRMRLERKLASSSETQSKSSRLQLYILTHLNSIFSPAPFYALTLTLFYFNGSFYHLGKRMFNLRYIFSRRLTKFEEQQRSGYEVLGVLLVVQTVVQTILHVQNLATAPGSDAGLKEEFPTGDEAEATLLDSRSRAAHATHTPLITAEEARFDLADPTVMAWLQPPQQRKCTLCLEPMKDPSATTCGHVFCWTCILDWIKEKPECPLCRQSALGQHVLPLRG